MSPGTSGGIVTAVRPFPDPQIGGRPVGHAPLSHHFDLSSYVARFDGDGHRSGVVTGRGDDRVLAGQVGYESPVLGDEARAGITDAMLRVAALERVLNRNVGNRVAAGVARRDVEMDHVAGAGRLAAGADVEHRGGICPHDQRQFSADFAIRAHRDHGAANRMQRHRAEGTHRCDVVVGAGEGEGCVVALGARGIGDRCFEPDTGVRIEAVRRAA